MAREPMSRVMHFLAGALVAVAVGSCGQAARPRQHGPHGTFIDVPLAVKDYRFPGAYLDAATEPSVVTEHRVRLDPAGVPMVVYGPRYEYNPVTIAQWGLRGWSRWDLRHDRADWRTALHAASWLVRHQYADGTWRYDFRFAPAGIEAVLNPGWSSAMAQGQAMSLLARVWTVTHDPPMRNAALRALAPLERPVADGGLVATFRGHSFYEEYPTHPPSLALNGFMFTLLGLYDLSRAAPHSAAHPLFARGMATLRWALPLYDTPSGFSIYHLGYLTQPGQPRHHSLYYQGVHVMLLYALDHVAPAARLRHYAARWNHYVPQPGDPP